MTEETEKASPPALPLPSDFGRGIRMSRRQIGMGALGAASMLAANTGTADAAGAPDRLAKCQVRVAAVSYTMPFHNHHKEGVNIAPLREMTVKVMRERPDFICFPENAATYGRGLEKDMEGAPALEPYVAEVAKIAREFNVAIVAPFFERDGDTIYNSAPVVSRTGELVLNYRKNYLTVYEMERGVTPGTEIPVGICDGVRVAASICYDANFDQFASELERQRARLVFWPSMYWGGQLLQHWAFRYGFAIAAAYNSESAIVDMNGRFLSRQGQETLQVRVGHLPAWAVADVHINRDLFHLDTNQKQFPAILEKYGPEVTIEVWEPEGYFHLASHRPDVPVETIAAEFNLETNRDFLARSVKMRSEILTRRRG